MRKTVRFEQEAPSAAASSEPYVALGYPASGETRSRLGSVFVQKSGHVGEDVQILRWVPCMRRMDGRVVTWELCWIGIEDKMPEISTPSRGKFGKVIRRS